MKTVSFKEEILSALLALIILIALVSCEQTGVEPKLDAAPGGGTLSTYKAYTLESTGGDNINGRVVFWKDNTNNTLVQISLYNTTEDTAYPTGIYRGSTAAGGASELIPLYAIDGTTGEFGTSKFYVIGNKTFYSDLDALDAHVRIRVGSTLVASGNVGSNSKPVAAAGN